ncbi:hypothetical protein T439DRAFT_330158 [Meredithblackwellia eburnea MCA 4105]
MNDYGEEDDQSSNQSPTGIVAGMDDILARGVVDYDHHLGPPSSSSAAGTTTTSLPTTAGGSKKKKSTATATATTTNGEDDGTGIVKKKRKQLVACDSCRLRRVKCDKAEMGQGDCSECVKKNIRCTDTYIKTKPKVVRSGKLIQQAKILYGDGNEQSTRTFIKSESPSATTAAGRSSQSPPSSSLIRATDARFFNQELARSIANHLIQVFRAHVHEQCAVVDLDHFQRNWDSAGHVAENMTPTGECVALVMQAWAARFSDHSAILGQSQPSLSDVSNSPPGTDFSQYGSLRDSFARAMEDRAMKALDQHGALRNPSGQCCAALTLIEFLVTWGDVYRNHGRHFMNAAVEHLRSRSDGITDDPTEVISPEDKVSGGTLFWVVYARDALSSAFGGRATALTTEDLTVLCEVLASPVTMDVLPYITSDDPRVLAGLAVVANFRHITTIIRSFCSRVSGPLPRRQRMDAVAIHEMWAAVDQSDRYSEIWSQSMNRTMLPAERIRKWMKDLLVMRSQLNHAIHINIVDRLDLEKSRLPTVRDPTFPAYVETLERLKQLSDVRMLRTSRVMAAMVRSEGKRLVFEAAMAAENIQLYTAHLLSTPVWEQGGPVSDWTIASKMEEVTWMIEGMKLIGWCWADFKRHIDLAEDCLADLAAFAQARMVAAQQGGPPPPTYGLQPQPVYQNPEPVSPTWFPNGGGSFSGPSSIPNQFPGQPLYQGSYDQQGPPQQLPTPVTSQPRLSVSSVHQPTTPTSAAPSPFNGYPQPNGFAVSRPPSGERTLPPMQQQQQYYDPNAVPPPHGGGGRDSPAYPFAWTTPGDDGLQAEAR